MNLLPPRSKSAFSLVELSIVLVILGLLVGGVLSGQSLIRAAELRSVSTDYSRYYAAVQAFRDKYFALPGDMANATSFWGKDSAACNGDSGNAATPGTCNGNGDGLFSVASAANGTAEVLRFWQQLALAGIIEGSYSGNSGANSLYDATPGTNIPRSKLSNAGWNIFTFPASIPNDGLTSGWINFEGNWGAQMVLGAKNGTGWYEYSVMKPEEMWNIDTKMDDGKPGTGNLRSYEYNGCTDTAPSTTTAIASIAKYDLSSNAIACSLLFNL